MEILPVVFKVRRTLERQLPGGRHFLLAVSGGADSLALADACAGLGGEGFGTYTVCHVEHGLRGAEGLRDMELVKSFCRERALSCVLCKEDVASYAKEHKLSTEEAARIVRYAALRRVAKEKQAQFIVTAHHADDQAETVLLRLLRGGALDGLAGMEERHADVLRPFLTLHRDELTAYCAARGIKYAHDSSNDDLRFTRNRIRRELLPYLRANFNPGISGALVRTAELLRADAECLDELAAAAYAESARKCADGSIALSAAGLNALPEPLASRVMRRACFELGLTELSYERTQALVSLLKRATGGKVIELPSKCSARYISREIVFRRE